MQHWLTHNLTYVNWCRLPSETQISSTDCPTNNKKCNNVQLCKFIISFQVFPKLPSKASYNPVNCRTPPNGISLHDIHRKTFCILSIISVPQNVPQFVSHQSSAAAQWGNSELVLSVCRALSVTGHQSSAHRLLQLPLLYQSVKTLAVHCHCYVCGAAGGHSAGCGRSWFCLHNKIS
jgi:hypothetical protein